MSEHNKLPQIDLEKTKRTNKVLYFKTKQEADCYLNKCYKYSDFKTYKYSIGNFDTEETTPTISMTYNPIIDQWNVKEDHTEFHFYEDK